MIQHRGQARYGIVISIGSAVIPRVLILKQIGKIHLVFLFPRELKSSRVLS